MRQTLMLACAGNGFLAVALGAFGAHGLQSRLAALPDAARRLSWWETAAHYHLVHAVALGLAALWCTGEARRWARVAGAGWLLGMALFCGSLYVMALTGMRWLGAVTPLGGLSLLAGWAALAVAAWRGTST